MASFIVAGFLLAFLSKASLPSTIEVTKLINFSVGHGLVGCFMGGHSAPVIYKNKMHKSVVINERERKQMEDFATRSMPPFTK